MEAPATRALSQSGSSASASQAGRQVAGARLVGRTGLAPALALTLALGACQQRSTDLDQIPGAASLDGATKDGFSLNTSKKDGSREGGPVSDAHRDGGLCSGANLQADPANCGACGNLCAIPHAQAACVAGLCVVGTCGSGYVDLDGKPENGCECQQSNRGVEICDGVDNNCDGQIDEGFNLLTDAANCGRCGNLCSFAHASGHCQRGQCGFDCLPGYVDLDGRPENGCEAACTPSNNGIEICDGKDNDCNGLIDDAATDVGQACGGNGCQPGVWTCISGARICVGAGQASQEVCDGRDNDCNGLIDESDPNLGKPCYPTGASGCSLQTGVCIGQCLLGAWACTAGTLVCTGAVTPQMEVCDGKDNDCDGLVDEDFDLQTDPRHCGSCDHICAYPHGIGLCSKGQCQMGP